MDDTGTQEVWHTRVGLQTRTGWTNIQMGDPDADRELYELLKAEGYNTYLEDVTVVTADGHTLTNGLKVWDYDLNRGTVMLTTMDSQGWFYVQTDKGRSLMNWERVCVRHPFTKEQA